MHNGGQLRALQQYLLAVFRYVYYPIRLVFLPRVIWQTAATLVQQYVVRSFFLLCFVCA